MGKTLVACFSAEGKTMRVAKLLAERAQADLYEIMPAKKYEKNDLDWMSTKSRVILEMKDPACRPELKETVENFGEYDKIFLGYPIWKFDAPRVIYSFLESVDYKGKNIVLFCTSDQSGIGKSSKALQAAYPDLKVVGERRFSISPTPMMMDDWIKKLDETGVWN